MKSCTETEAIFRCEDDKINYFGCGNYRKYLNIHPIGSVSLENLTHTHTYDPLPSFSVWRKKCLPSFQGKWCLLIHLQLLLGPSFEWLLSRRYDIYLQIYQQTPLTPNWLNYSAIKSLHFYIYVLLLMTTKECKMALAFFAFLLSQILLILQVQAQLPSALSLHLKLICSCFILLHYYHTFFSNYSIVILCISFLSLIIFNY